MTTLAFCMTSFFACKKNAGEDVFQDVVTREDYRSVYGQIGDRITIADVREDADGRAFAQVDGVEYELGMDFLSMAMVYNTKPVGAFATAEAVYNEWWRLFMQRWNMLVPEAPLYSNQYYDVYSSYDGDLSLPLGLALGSPIFPSGCEGKLGVALESLQGLRDLT